MEMRKNPVAVCAVDFGTSRSGYAFSFNDPAHIINNNFGKDQSLKVPTCLLLQKHKENYQFKLFGNDAYNKLPTLSPEDKVVHAFKFFKMNLFNETTMVKAQNNVELPLVEVITHSLWYIVNEALDHMYRITNYQQRIFSQDVQWVVTVPAIWNDKAKHVMRVAAQRAGLPDTLILALEPEAAALCIRQNKKELQFTPGTKYMVVDCGGGTVDIAAHEIDDKGYTQSISAPIGDNWGSTRIDEAFKKLLGEVSFNAKIRSLEEDE